MQMKASSNPYSLVIASVISLAANAVGTMLALQHNLTADFGGFLNGQNVLRIF